MKRALVTGSAGFLGRHFCTALADRGYSVDRWDITTGRDALTLFGDGYWHRPDLLVHCAAQEPFRAAIDSKPELMVANLMLDAAMFRWVMRSSAREMAQMRVLYFSSSAAYPLKLQDGDPPRLLSEDLISADHIDRSDADYGWVKITGEHLASNARAMDAQVTVVRPFSGYAEDQSTNHPFAAFVERVQRRENPFTIWGPGTQVRDWIHVADLVAGAMALVDNAVDGPVNLCTGAGTSMRDLVGMMCAEVGYTPAIELKPDQPAGVAYRVGSPELLSRWYTPQISLAEGVKRALS